MISLTYNNNKLIMVLKNVPDYFQKGAVLFVPKTCPSPIKTADKRKKVLTNTGIYKFLNNNTLDIKTTYKQRVTKTGLAESLPLRFTFLCQKSNKKPSLP